MDVYEVANIEAGVELANRFKDEHKYDWFRGQVRDWPPVSSWYRILASGNTEAEARVRRRIAMFFQWIGGIPELRYLREPEHVNDCFAIMQHYGIPTHYIDFTTEPSVAGFFAADTTNPHYS